MKGRIVRAPSADFPPLYTAQIQRKKALAANRSADSRRNPR